MDRKALKLHDEKLTKKVTSQTLRDVAEALRDEAQELIDTHYVITELGNDDPSLVEERDRAISDLIRALTEIGVVTRQHVRDMPETYWDMAEEIVGETISLDSEV